MRLEITRAIEFIYTYTACCCFIFLSFGWILLLRWSIISVCRHGYGVYFSWTFHSRVWNSFNSLESQFLLKVVQSQRDFSITGAETQYAKKSCITGAKKQLDISNNDVNWISRIDVTHWSFGILARSELQWLDRSCVSRTIMKLLWFDKRALDRCR